MNKLFFLSLFPFVANAEVAVNAKIQSDSAASKILAFLDCRTARTGESWRWAAPSEPSDIEFREQGGKLVLSEKGKTLIIQNPALACDESYPISLTPKEMPGVLSRRSEVPNIDQGEEKSKLQKWWPWAILGAATLGGAYLLTKQKGAREAYLR
jgi:hypothetical protein